MIKKFAFLLLLSFSLSSCTPELQEVLEQVLVGTTEDLSLEDISKGLKQALEQGIVKGAKNVSVPDGYFKNPTIKILFPPEAQKVEQKLNDIGLGFLADTLTLRLNRAAELAAKEAAPIFKEAITQMTFNDAMDILTGGIDTAATAYLRATTSDMLYAKFNPVIQKSLGEVKALDHWTKVIDTYNKIPFVQKMNPDLNDYVTTKAIDGLFVMVAKEEKLIRKDPVARTTELMRKVFAKQDR